MTCSEALRLLEFARPGATELDAADIGALECHLAGCSACAAFAHAEASAAEHIIGTLQAVEPPPEARARLLASLAQLRRRWWLKMGSIAASLVLVAVAGWRFYPAPAFNPDAIAFGAHQQIANREAAEEWLARENSHFRFPPGMRSTHLIGLERQSFHGVSAPVLTFVHDNSLARVAVLTSRQFRNLSELGTGHVAENSTCSIVVLRDPDHPDVVYVVEVINGRIELFLTEDDASVT